MKELAGFQIEERVATNTLATVYRGRRGGEVAAIKVYRPGLAQGERIGRERRAQAQIAHPCVARLIDWGVADDGSAYLVSQWIAGTRLEDRLAAGPLDWPSVQRLAWAIGQGLAAIHAAGIVHRDLKPSNVILPEDGRPAAVLLDFGCSLLLADERLTDQGLVLGSASYMAPEQAAGRSLDGRADLYALGVILYRALTGALPFAHPSPAEVLRLHQWEPVTPPRARAPGLAIPAAAEDLCMWLLAKDPDVRLPSARVLAVTLGALQSQPARAPEERLP